MLSPLIFKIDGKALRVKKKKYYQTKFTEDTAYLLSNINPYVYPYNGEINNKSDAIKVGIYMLKGHTYIRRPYTDEEKSLYSVSNIIKLTPQSIFEDVDANKGNYISIETNNSYTDDEIFKPELKVSDDIALAGMKFAIGKKNINFNSYANRFQDQATKNNGRRALTHGTALKMDMLSRFADVFDIGVALVFFDKKGCNNPMDPKYKDAYVIFDSDHVDLSKKNFIEISADVKREDDSYYD